MGDGERVWQGLWLFHDNRTSSMGKIDRRWRFVCTLAAGP